MEDRKLTWCFKCGKCVREVSANIHIALCKGKIKKQLTPKSVPKLGKNIHKPGKPQMSRFTNRKAEQSLEVCERDYSDDIVCPKCSKEIDINDLERHMDSCEYLVCDLCSEAYPRPFLDEHKRYCRISHERSNHRLQENDSDDDSYRPSAENHEDESDPDDLNNHLLYQNMIEGGRPLLHSRGFVSRMPSWYVQQNNRDNQFFNNTPNQHNSEVTIERIHRDHDGNVIRSISRISNSNRASNFYDPQALDRELINLYPNFFSQDIMDRLLEELTREHKGLSEMEINMIPKVKYRVKHLPNGEEKDKCPICITELEDKTVVRNLPCNHIFHPQCIDTWLASNPQCPICKAVVQASP